MMYCSSGSLSAITTSLEFLLYGTFCMFVREGLANSNEGRQRTVRFIRMK